MSMRTKRNALLSLLALFVLPELAAGQGVVLPGVGPINRSMAGAATAAPLDAAGAIHWNPGSMSGLCDSQVVLAADLLYHSSDLYSEIAGGPAGSTRSDTGVDALPALAAVWRPYGSRWTYGLGLFTVGSLSQNYPADDPTNPANTVLQPPPFGLGPVYSELTVTQIVPSVAFEITDHLSIGMAPTISYADVALDPFLFTSQDANNAWPAATHRRTQWGLGIQGGIFYQLETGWRFGLSYKSPQWFESFDFPSIDSRGTPQSLSLDLDYPGISSIGVSYAGHPGLVWALDVRYIDYDSAEFFGHRPSLDGTGRAEGLGWRSVLSVATGVQYAVLDCLDVRLGYAYTQNPIRPEATFVNIPYPAILEHVGTLGATWKISHRTSVSLAYMHAFENASRGPIPPPVAAGGGSTVATRQSADALTAGVEIRF